MTDIPADFGSQLAGLHPGIRMVVPNELLKSCFCEAPRQDREVDEKTKAAARAFALRFGCIFYYSPVGGDCEQGEGVFHKAP